MKLRLWHYAMFVLVAAVLHQVVRHGVNSLWRLL